jgi:hypothetical protein
MKRMTLCVALVSVFCFSCIEGNLFAQTIENAKPFLKHWKGQWETDAGGKGKGPLAELIVEEKDLNYKSEPSASWKLRGADFRVPYEIKGNVLSFQSKTSGKTFYFKLLDDGSLEGHRSDDPISKLVLK